MERIERHQQFEEFLAELNVLNTSEKVNNSTAVFGNVHADLSPEEFRMQYLGAMLPEISERRLTILTDVPAYKGTAASVDWTSTLTTPIKDQGGCGSC